MRFSFWHYVGKAAPILFLLSGAGMLFGDAHPVVKLAGDAALAAIIVLGSAGAVMGLIWVLGKLRFICPFCGASGEPFMDARNKMCLACDNCGIVHEAGFLGLKLVSEPYDYDEDGDPGE